MIIYSVMLKSCNDVSTSGLYSIRPASNGPVYQVYCDIDTPGGPWMLLYSYNHIGGENKPLVADTIPTSPTNGYSHVHLNTFKDANGNSVFGASKVRFYCQTSAHTRKIHFYTSNNVIDQMAYDGILSKNVASLWTSGFTPLSDHTGYLPAQTGDVLTIGLWDHPFYKVNSYHWNVRSAGYRYECDDFPNDNLKTTLHQIWVNTGICT